MNFQEFLTYQLRVLGGPNRDQSEFDYDNDMMPIQDTVRPECYKSYKVLSRDGYYRGHKLSNIRYIPSSHQDKPNFTLNYMGSQVQKLSWDLNWILFLIDQQRKPSRVFSSGDLQYLSYSEYCHKFIHSCLSGESSKRRNYREVSYHLREKIGNYYNFEIPVRFSVNLKFPGEYSDFSLKVYPFGGGEIKYDQHDFEKCSCNNPIIGKTFFLSRLFNLGGQQDKVLYDETISIRLYSKSYSSGMFINLPNMTFEKIQLILNNGENKTISTMFGQGCLYGTILEKKWDQVYLFDKWVFLKFDDRSLLDNIISPNKTEKMLNFPRIQSMELKFIGVKSNDDEVMINIHQYEYNILSQRNDGWINHKIL